MTNKEIYELMDQLGLVDDTMLKGWDAEQDSLKLKKKLGLSLDDNIPTMSDSEEFEKFVCKDTVKLVTFMDDLFTLNDTNSIRRFFTVLLIKNSEEKDN